MIKNRLISGTVLLVVALTGASFTSYEASQSYHWVQGFGECKPIPETNCTPSGPTRCSAQYEGFILPVYLNPSPENETVCETLLYKID